MTLTYRQYGNKKSKKVIFMLHGFGDDEESYVDLAENINSNYNYYCIRAPIPLYMGGYSWHYIPEGNDVISSEYDKVIDDITKSILDLNETIKEIIEMDLLVDKELILFGFSQGCFMCFSMTDSFNFSKIFGICGYAKKSDIIKIDNKIKIYYFFDEKDPVINKKLLGAETLFGDELYQELKNKNYDLEYIKTNSGHSIDQNSFNLIKKYMDY